MVRRVLTRLGLTVGAGGLALALASCGSAGAPSSAPISVPAPAYETPSAAESPSVQSTPSGQPVPSVSATPSAAKTSAQPTKAATTKPTDAKTTSASTTSLAGLTIVVDPGHNKVNNSKNNVQVPMGAGLTKACVTSGTETNDHWPEHTYNWLQANALADELRARGATVVLTRTDDASQGPCVNVRAQTANDKKADLLISIHADGNLSSSARGFHVIYSTAMEGGATVQNASKTFATKTRDAIEAGTDMPRSTYIGNGSALSPRSDLATVNLLETTPGIMLEMGNMRHAADAKLLKSAEFRTQAAVSIANAVAATFK